MTFRELSRKSPVAKEDEHVREDKKECVCLSCVCGLIYSTYIKLCSTLKNEDVCFWCRAGVVNREDKENMTIR